MKRHRFVARAVYVAACWLALATLPAAINAAEFSSVLIRDIPHVRQKPDFCGEACAEMFLTKLGKKLDQDFVFDQADLDPLEGRGCYTRELATALRRIGFDIGPVWYAIRPSSATSRVWRNTTPCTSGGAT